MAARFESTLRKIAVVLRVIEVVDRVQEAAQRLAEVVVAVVCTTHVEVILAAAAGICNKDSNSSIRRAVALEVNRVVQTLAHKATNQIHPRWQSFSRIIAMVFCLPSALHGYPFQRLAFSAWRYGGIVAHKRKQK